MAKVRKQASKVTKKVEKEEDPRVRSIFLNTLNTVSTSRRELLNKLFDDRRDIDDECGYPKEITAAQYRYMYDREGLATRVVKIYPEESWADDPEVYEDEDPEKETEFEKVFNQLEKEHNVWYYLQRADELSGIGRFGILLLGLDDGKLLSAPVEPGTERKLLYLRTFDESKVSIDEVESDVNNERYGKPLTYSVNFADNVSTQPGEKRESKVHWSRVVHLADNRMDSEVYGVPRIQSVYNRLFDIRKVLSGSGEMFWKGAFPGYAFETNPDLGDVEIDEDSLKDTVQDYFNGLQRYMSLMGVQVKSLDPQVADPSSHIQTQIKVLAMAMGVPHRIFMGTEEAKLAGQKDTEAWNKRLFRRQSKYVTPMVIRPFIDQLMAVGVLPEVEEYEVKWPDLNAPSDQDVANVAKAIVEALAKYVGGNVDTLMPPLEFFTIVLGYDKETAEQIIEAASEYIAEMPEPEMPEPEMSVGQPEPEPDKQGIPVF